MGISEGRKLSPEEQAVFERLGQILAKEFEVAPELINPAARMDQLAIDSLAVLEVIFRLEDEFKINFPQDPGELKTVGDLVTAIDRLATEQRVLPSSGSAGP
jgi:acyl carrier protein